ncbi:ATP phosphoribosyltransferase regulatory subunit [Rhodoferax sp. 4810]|uniref:ATP phosphoribosyltransferase regulatory subunit n=1 Tax=Thiospirillum jenense TaxID=1653858 RepID=A0A839HJ78_9GAMM|nr:ATP phosphoribosyltransferase regulatory subunit [Thiospirillum jenense]MBB1076152.1 ATP phosphoribosyltransferase regulatory subunit [Rhodoferax jenense]MBB1126062.1 ATP phosphoribosyltransferase regulatory subunit [Thiospirillum jenense]
MNDAQWLLPVGIEEALPEQAQRLEQLRRALLDLYASWGYELVVTPFIDYLDSLLTGTGHDLDLQTFKLTDQLSGRLLGIRADMTPQVARMDAHQLKRNAPTRLCYLGTVLHTRSDGFAGTRSPMQIGAELFGHAGAESDVEILRLLLLTLAAAGIESPYLDLGHVGIYRALAQQAKLTRAQEMTLFDVLQRKAAAELTALILDEWQLTSPIADMLLGLIELNGDDALERAELLFAPAQDAVQVALDNLRQVANQLHAWLPQVPVHFDLAELRGYTYKTGVVFAAFVPGWGLEIARGGRYDDIGKVFGHARPAVGFSSDLKGLMALANQPPPPPRTGILAPWRPDAALQIVIDQLRAAGQRVIHWLPGQVNEVAALGCHQQLIYRNGAWQLAELTCDQALHFFIE